MNRGRVAIVGFFAAACSGGANPGPPRPAHPGDWACVGSQHGAAAAAPVRTVQPAIPFAMSLQDAYTHASVGDLLLAVCRLEDEDCTTPSSQGKADPAGHATLTAPGGPSSFGGFVRVSGAGIATHYVFLADRAGTCPSCPLVLPIYTSSALETTAEMTGLKLDVRGAMIRADLEDCSGAPAKDVSISIGSFGCSELGAGAGLFKPGFPFGSQGCAGPLVAYATGGTGSVTRAALRTDATGIALGFGVPPGRLGVAEVLDGKTVAGALGFTRAGAVSELVLRPRFSHE